MTKAVKRSITVFVLLIAVGISALIYTLCFGKSGNTVVIKKQGEEIGAYSLYVDKTVDLETNTLVIENGKVYMKSADCRDQICVKHAPIFETNDTIVCLPNKIIVEIK